QNPSPYKTCVLGVTCKDRQKLYDRINRRVETMLVQGLLDEARRFFESAPLPTASQAIGHKELFPYFRGEISLDEAIETLKRKTRNYAKRQLTWFRKNPEIHWIYSDLLSEDNLIKQAEEIVCNLLELAT
ncbi:MAG: tRNA (adenosine(37)-N6)-dimethylallyltransferase MiaA, partial [Oscillospiraceae bacterium]|nr:tRNA (adenosine(37)-N6)-dimethylallyltransferase MiaA [Oscillospiraceae bacterium]